MRILDFEIIDFRYSRVLTYSSNRRYPENDWELVSRRYRASQRGCDCQNVKHHHAYDDRYNIYPRIALEDLERRLMFYAYHEKKCDIVDGESCPLENCLRKDNGDGTPGEDEGPISSLSSSK